MRHIDKLIVHCSDTPDSRSVSVEDIRRWHVKDNGWSDIGYHFIIKRNGDIETGRPIWAIGAHCRGQNTNSIGVCLIGRSNFDDRQFKSLQNLYDTLKHVFDNFEVYGHRDFDSNKTCPNFEVRDILCSQE